jgi:hypothetical protein
VLLKIYEGLNTRPEWFRSIRTSAWRSRNKKIAKSRHSIRPIGVLARAVRIEESIARVMRHEGGPTYFRFVPRDVEYAEISRRFFTIAGAVIGVLPLRPSRAIALPVPIR